MSFVLIRGAVDRSISRIANNQRIKEMKRLLVPIILGLMTLSAVAQDKKRDPEALTLTQAMVADSGASRQYVFVINGVVAFNTVDGLKKHLKNLPTGSTLTWAPGCVRRGGEPLLDSQAEMTKFKEFCDSIGIKFILVPAG